MTTDLFERFYKHQRFFNSLDRLHIKPWHWLALSVVFIGIDFTSGPMINFPILYIIPIALAGWFTRRRYALLLCIFLPSTRLIFRILWDIPWIVVDSVVNLLVRIAVFVSIALIISFAKELNVLRGFLQVCSYCGKVKDKDEKWVPLQDYVAHRSEILLSHGVCPDCIPKLEKDLGIPGKAVTNDKKQAQQS